jgi:hypothetical protein
MKRRIGALLSLVSGAATLSCGDGGLSRAHVASLSGEVAEAAASLTGQQAQLASEDLSDSGHMGFDTGVYPGDGAMRAWRTGGAPYEWAGYYLPSPCHPDTSWSGKRETVTNLGYGIAVLYVGQQTWGRTPGKPHYVPVTVTRKVRVHVGHGSSRHTVLRSVKRTVMRKAPLPKPTETCNADFVSASRGERDGADAAFRTALEGFPTGTTVFLDLERMDEMPTAMRKYYSAWVRTMLEDGRYRPGIYVHTDNANTVYSDVKEVFVAAGHHEEPPFWIAKSEGFDARKLPHQMGHAFAVVWQGVLDVEETWAGHKIPIDVNISGTRSPSSALTSYRSAAITGSRLGD